MIKLVDPMEQQKQKDEFKGMLYHVSTVITESPIPPTGIFVFLFSADGSIKRFQKVADNCDLFQVVGSLEYFKRDILSLCQSRIQPPPSTKGPAG